MSHIKTVRAKWRSLEDLEAAAKACGLVLRRGQTTHAWYGQFVGDSQPPAGRNPRDYGRCEHALQLADHRPGDYEIGLVKALDGDGYEPLYDDWGSSGARLTAAAGRDLQKLRQEYAIAHATRTAREKLARHGYTVVREALPAGRVRLRVRQR